MNVASSNRGSLYIMQTNINWTGKAVSISGEEIFLTPFNRLCATGHGESRLSVWLVVILLQPNIMGFWFVQCYVKFLSNCGQSAGYRYLPEISKQPLSTAQEEKVLQVNWISTSSNGGHERQYASIRGHCKLTCAALAWSRQKYRPRRTALNFLHELLHMQDIPNWRKTTPVVLESSGDNQFKNDDWFDIRRLQLVTRQNNLTRFCCTPQTLLGSHCTSN